MWLRPDQITNTKSSALFVEEEEEEAVKPNVRDKIGFRDNRVSWLRFESIHFRENRESERNKERDKLKVLVFQECFGE